MDRSVGGPLPSLLDEPVFVGRRRELASIHQFLDDVRDGLSGILLIEAEAGAGKTSVLRQVVTSEATRNDFTVCESAGDPSDSRALRCVTDALDCRLTSHDSARVRIAELLRSPTVGALVSTVAGVQELVVDVVERDALKSPMLIVIDDLQWVDEASLLLLGSLLRRLRGMTFGVLRGVAPKSAGAVAAACERPRTRSRPPRRCRCR